MICGPAFPIDFFEHETEIKIRIDWIPEKIDVILNSRDN